MNIIFTEMDTSSDEFHDTSPFIHTTYDIKTGRRIVDTPFQLEPYEVQKEMVDIVVRTIDKKESALIESPPGSGKTLALLSSSLSWLEANSSSANTPTQQTKQPRLKIFYCSRTHSQIAQVTKELKKTILHSIFKFEMTTLASRKQKINFSDRREIRICINGDIKDAEIEENCRSLRNNGRRDPNKNCKYYSNWEVKSLELKNNLANVGVWDIEDATNYCLRNDTCPYYGLRSMQEDAHINFLPYDYLFNPSIRRKLELDIEGAIIIIDEGHNIESVCRKSASFSVKRSDIIEMSNIIEKRLDKNADPNIEIALEFVKKKFNDLLKSLDNISNRSTSIKNEDLLVELESIGLHLKAADKIKDNLKILRKDDNESDASYTNSWSDPFNKLDELRYVIQLLYSNRYGDYVLVRECNSANNNNNKWSLFCNNANFIFDEVREKARSIIIASATLAPLNSFRLELGCVGEREIKIYQLEHRIDPEKIFAAAIGAGPEGSLLICTHKCWVSIHNEITTIIVDVCSKVRGNLQNGGVLCFLPNKEHVNNFYNSFKARMSFSRMDAIKAFKENDKGNINWLEEYRESAKNGVAILFAVYRGTVSEGIDFKDEMARAVITVGKPLPPFKEEPIKSKKSYEDDEIRRTNSDRNWYEAQATRPLFQAAGRCIRHKNDWGAIIMIDDRIRDTTMPKWLQGDIVKNYNNREDYSKFEQDLNEFMKKDRGSGDQESQSFGRLN